MAIKGLKSGGVTVQDSDSSQLIAGFDLTGLQGIGTIRALKDGAGADIVAGPNGAMVGYVQAIATNVNFQFVDLGYSDTNAGGVFVNIIPKELLTVVEDVATEFNPIAIFVPAGKFISVRCNTSNTAETRVMCLFVNL